MYDLSKAGAKTSQVMKPTNDNTDDISFFEVKDLYESAYAVLPADGTETVEFTNLLKKAEMMDLAYRAQLSIKQTLRYQYIPENTAPNHAVAA